MELKQYWEANVKKNIKKISALMGDIIITIFSVLLIGIRTELDWIIILLWVVYAVKPFLTMYVNLVFKGDVSELNQHNIQLNQQLLYERDIAEYRCILAAAKGEVPAAIMANRNWVEANSNLETDIQETVDKLNEQVNKIPSN